MKNIVLGLAGEAASGKGTISKYLQERYGAKSYRFSDVLRNILDSLYMEKSRDTMQRLSTSLREIFGEDLFARGIAEEVKRAGEKIIVIDGARRMADIRYLKENPDFKLVYLEADMKNRYERITKRGENSDDSGKTFKEFQKDHERETEVSIRELKQYADFLVSNDGDLDNLYKQIDKIIK